MTLPLYKCFSMLMLSESDRIQYNTSNKSFSEWGEILGDSVMASTVLDRILHHCTVINIKGESYRLKDRKKNSLPTMRKE